MLKVIRLLPENRILAVEGRNKFVIYGIPEFRWTRPLEISHADENLQQPIWTVWLAPQIKNYSAIELSKPSYGPFATHLALMQGDQIYGLVIPHDGGTPTLHVLAIVPDLGTSGVATICIDKIYKIYGEPPFYGRQASVLTFSWPEEADSLAQSIAWVPPVLYLTPKQFAGHHTSVIRGDDLVDDVSGRIVTGSKDEIISQFPEEVDGVEWSDIIYWSVVDFFHPQFLPESFES